MLTDHTFEPIGIVESNYRQKFATPRQPGLVKESRAFIHIYARYQPELSLQGLESFSHVWVLFVFHRNDNVRFRAKVHPPRLHGKTMGVFATRSPHRPNPIGLSLVEIETVESNGLWVRGIDLMDDTPILDIKPYLPAIESHPEASEGWVENIKAHSVEVRWLNDAAAEIETAIEDLSRLKSLIEQTVKLDPRPLVYHGENGGESKYRDSHVTRIENFDVHFYFEDFTHAVIKKIVKIESL